MAESAVGFLLNQLSTLILQESTLLGGLRPEIQFIRDELGSMRAFLRDAEAIEDNVSELQEWVRQVREVAYATEHVLDEFTLRFAHHHADGFYGRVQKIYCSIKNLRARHEISSKIKSIKSDVENISARRQRYQQEYGASKIGFTSEENIVNYIRGNALFVEEAKLVGIDEPKRELISQVLSSNSSLKVISMFGMGGLRKTTLLKRVYEDTNVKRQFQSHAWLTVSKTFNMKMTLKDLIQQLFNEIKQPIPQPVESMDGDKLREFIKDFLQERNYIIVLDDIWSTDSWDVIKYALPDTKCGSRIMLSTRIADIAFGSCGESYDYVHEMNPLSVEESWTLFCNRTFGENCFPPPHLEDVSKRIVRKCEGLPLAIISIGGILALKQKKQTG